MPVQSMSAAKQAKSHSKADQVQQLARAFKFEGQMLQHLARAAKMLGQIVLEASEDIRRFEENKREQSR